MKVLTHWACEKLRSPKVRDMPDKQLRDLIREKLKPCGTMSYTQIALMAYDQGRS